MKKIPVLYTAKNSIYKQIKTADPWDETRDATKWPGGVPCIAHPPCRLWSILRHLSTADPVERYLGLIAVCQVRLNGGILEHPAYSTLWRAAQLPPPGGFPDEYGGYTIEIDQVKAGHRARKRTWLYIVGAENLPPLPTPENRATHVLDTGKSIRHRAKLHVKTPLKRSLGKNARAATPEPFAHWLLSIARTITPRNNNTQDNTYRNTK